MCRSDSLPFEKCEDGSGVVVDPAAKLEENWLFAPTSETIIWNTYKNWIQSYRDLLFFVISGQTFSVGKCVPVFLRTAEFLWQEGHTAHATRKQRKSDQNAWNVYGEFAEKYMAVPVVKGVKSANERFASAWYLYL